ncbi:MAG: T9SS type A sorting domain-containing protein [Saprospiraceae bacterium]|nr:T9SS type A sorting domain-containing protein [Saprospiraceae bacterium]
MRMNSTIIASFILAIGFSTNSLAQGPILDSPVLATQANKLGTTLPLSELMQMPLADEAKQQLAKKYKPGSTVPNFFGREQAATGFNPDAQPKGPDPTRQTSTNKSGPFVVEPIVNVNGMDAIDFGGAPPDPTGAVGKDHYIQMINASLFQIFDKSGNELTNPISANTIWASVGVSGSGDPIILYDQEVDRWLMTEFTNADQMLMALSESSDPTGAWTAYEFTAPNFPDFPKYAIWPNAYIVTTNEFGNQLPMYVIDRQAMLAGEEAVAIQRLGVPRIFGGPGFQVTSPIDWDGDLAPPADALPMIIRMNDDAWNQTSTDRLEIYTMDIDFDNPNNTDVFGPQLINTAPFDANPCALSGANFACIPQPNGQGIDGSPAIIMQRVQYRNFGTYETIVLNFITDVAGGSNLAGIRWYELRRDVGTTNWGIYQEGTFAPDDDHNRFMGSIAMDGAGNIGLAYSVSSSTKQPSLRFTGRRASDPLGEMTIEEFEFGIGNGNSNIGRWGDYAQMSVDPEDDRTFWFTGEFMKFATSFGTRVVAFQVGRDTLDLGPVALDSPVDAPLLTATEDVTIQVQNLGLDAFSDFTIGYSINNGPAVTEVISAPLNSDDIYMHTFSQTADLSAIGDYNFKVFTTLSGDENILNDTLRYTVRHLPRYDAGVTNIVGLENQVCATDKDIDIEITNFGTETLSIVDINWQVNGGNNDNMTWLGALGIGESAIVTISITGIQDGINMFEVSTENPNGEVDEVPSNDALNRNFDAETNGVTIIFTLETDSAPHETTWELEDSNGNVIYEGGPYAQLNGVIVEEWCLDPNECYDFFIYDSEGDGLSTGDGTYSIMTLDGIVLASLIQENFGSSENTDFCGTPACMFDVDLDISQVTGAGANDGAILISPSSGVAPFQYSINGGNTFQQNGMFTDLGPGLYQVLVLDDNDCEFEEYVELVVCTMIALPAISDPSSMGAADGQITVTVVNATNPIQLSLNGGDFQGVPAFYNLVEGFYDILIVDANGCEILLENLAVGDPVLATSAQADTYSIEVFPNPNQGIFRINLIGLEGVQKIPVQIYDAAGRLLHYDQIVRYGNMLTGQISLMPYAPGTYFVRIMDKQVDQLVKVVKQ